MKKPTKDTPTKTNSPLLPVTNLRDIHGAKGSQGDLGTANNGGFILLG